MHLVPALNPTALSCSSVLLAYTLVLDPSLRPQGVPAYFRTVTSNKVLKKLARSSSLDSGSPISAVSYPLSLPSEPPCTTTL